MKKLYEKNETAFAVVWIAVYCVLQSLANPLNKMMGVEYAASAFFCVLQTVVLFAFLRKNHLQKRYGLCKSTVPAWRFLYYVPLVVLATGNLWSGVAVHYTPVETVCRIVCMLCVGFLEEVIFRGLLFVALARENVRSAVVISSVTFGIGHIINLLNGSGMELVNNLCQITLPSRWASCWSPFLTAAGVCSPAFSSTPPSTRWARLQMTRDLPWKGSCSISRC